MADTATQKAPGLPSKTSKMGSEIGSKKDTVSAPGKLASQKDDAESRINGTQTNGTQNGEYEEQTEDGTEATTEAPVPNEEEGTEAIPAGSVNEKGEIIDHSGNVIGKVDGDKASELAGSMVDQEGDILDKDGNIIGHSDSVVESLKNIDPKPIEEVAEGAQKPLEDAAEGAKDSKPELEGPFGIQDNGDITNAQGEAIGKLADGKPQDLVGTSIKEIDDEGNLRDKSGSVIGKGEILQQFLEKSVSQVGSKLPRDEEKSDLVGSNAEEAKKDLPGGVQKPETELPEGVVPEVEAPDLSILKDKTVNKLGKIVDADGNPFGILVEGEAKKLAGKKVDAEGKIWDDAGKVLGRAELLPEDERTAEPSAPFEDFPDAIVDSKGNVIFEGKIVGKVIEGDPKKLEGKKIDADGDILDKNGNTLGKAERFQEEEELPQEEQPEDVSELEGKKVNKAGNVVDDQGKLFGKVVEGEVAKLIGKKCDKEGKIWSESGKVIGRAELIPVDDREQDAGAPFEDFPDATLDAKGNVMFDGLKVGQLVEGDPKKLAGKKVDKDGEVLDKVGNVLGKCERFEEPEEPEAEKIDMSILAGKRVNKNGNLVDSHGDIYGKVIEGDLKKLVGKMSDKDGNIWNDGGQIIGKAELVPESERQGDNEGPFAGFADPIVTKDGKVADSKGVIVGRLVEGDAKKLYGKKVDADGDVIDSNGNTLGKAERWEEEEAPEKPKSAVFGRKCNKDGNVVDDSGDVIAKLTEGEISKCAGREIDNDGDIINEKGQTLGHVTLIGDIPEAEPVPEEPKESEEEIAARKQIEQDKKLAGHISAAIQDTLDRIKPILSEIMDKIDAVEAQKEEDRDEQKLVDQVRPLIEEGGRILAECNGTIRALDPDGRIQANAKQKSKTREATPEEAQLAENLKELTENVHRTIEKAKKKIAGMPHAKKELNPLWGLLAEPLGQILAAVGLLLAGVLGLVGRLLSGLGLGGLLDNLLGGLGLKGILKGLGLGMVTESLTGKK